MKNPTSQDQWDRLNNPFCTMWYPKLIFSMFRFICNQTKLVGQPVNF